jgi:diacylglycerol kinase (ATP)
VSVTHPAIVLNGGKPRAPVERLCAEVGPLPLYVSADFADLEAQTRRALDAGHDLIVSAGGDGTLLGVLRGLRGSDAAVTVLPLGTANDFAKCIGIRRGRDTAAALKGGRVRSVDLGLCTYADPAGRTREEAFCVSAGVGFTAALTELEQTRRAVALKRRLGNGAFVLLAAWLVLTFPGGAMAVTLDGRRTERTVSLLEVSKVPSVGGMPLTPDARLDSGRFDVALFHGGAARRARLLVGLQLSSGHVRWPDYEYVGADPALNTLGVGGVKEVEVEPAWPMPLHLQGEPVGRGAARFRLLPGALRALGQA